MTIDLRKVAIATALVSIVGIGINLWYDAIARNTLTDKSSKEVTLASIPDVVKQQYRQDAAKLALRIILAENSSAATEIDLPTDLVEKLSQSLLAVYQTNSPARNAVVETYNIHTAPNPDSVIVDLDTSQEWTQAWRERKQLTNNDTINGLISRYGLEVRHFDYTDIVALQTTKPINTYALANTLETIPGITNAKVKKGVNNLLSRDIEAEIKDNYIQLNYRLSLSDCVSGCSAENWVFQVDSEGKVKYLEEINLESGIKGRSLFITSGGAPPPPWLPQNITIAPAVYAIAVYNQTGKQVTRIIPDENGSFQVNLKPGVYHLHPESSAREGFSLSNKDQKQVTVTQGQYTTINFNYFVAMP
ncbi:MAG: carboxypeptidase regulatory-like domain-containing protein [Kamptonema sp. SIO1D9]|nr:carboxypeptidase regulatory-like domain-containing protein [Kamptonema sp. SIO1D9]